MKKGAFIEYIQHNLSAGLTVDDTRKKYPTQVIEMAVDLVVQDLLNTGMTNQSIGALLVPKTGSAEIQRDGNRKYIELPYTSISSSRGILMVTPDMSGIPYDVYANASMMTMYRELQQSNMSNGLYLENNKYFFIRDPLVDEVVVVMYVVLSEYDDDDDFTLGDKHVLVYNLVIEMMNVNMQRIEDRINNQGPDGIAN